MIRIDKLVEKIYGFASVRSAKSWILTPVVGGLFAVFTWLFIAIPVNLELYLKFPVILSPPVNYYISAPFFVTGLPISLLS